MVIKSKKSSKRKVKVNKLSRPSKTLGKKDMKKVKGGTLSLNFSKIQFND